MRFLVLRYMGKRRILAGLSSTGTLACAVFEIVAQRRLLRLRHAKPHRQECLCYLMHNRLVGFDFAVANMNDAIGAVGDVVFVRDEDDCVPLGVQARKERHDFIAGL